MTLAQDLGRPTKTSMVKECVGKGELFYRAPVEPTLCVRQGLLHGVEHIRGKV